MTIKNIFILLFFITSALMPHNGGNMKMLDILGYQTFNLLHRLFNVIMFMFSTLSALRIACVCALHEQQCTLIQGLEKFQKCKFILLKPKNK